MKFLLYLNPLTLFVIFIASLFFASDSSYGLYIGFIFAIVYAAWIYQIGGNMYTLVADLNKPGIKYFQFSCVFNPCIVIFGQLFNLYLIQYIPDRDTVEPILNILIPVYMAWSWVYINLFAARMLKSASEDKLVKRSDSLKNFFGLLFFPIGVWYIQPSVQKVLNKYESPRSRPVENN
jgi:hypothetical protein